MLWFLFMLICSAFVVTTSYINQGEKELMELSLVKERTEMYLRDEHRKAASCIEEKGNTLEIYYTQFLYMLYTV